MKKNLVIILSLVIILNLIVISADTCTLNVSLLNQDPYPAVPGDYVKVVFQLKGVENKACTDVIFSVVPDYPFSFDTGEDHVIKIKGGTYTNNFDSFLMAPYKLRVASDAIEGDNPLKVKYSSDSSLNFYITNEFDINVQEVKTEFEVYIKNYDPVTHMMTFEVLNSGENDVEALTLSVPKQDNIEIKGSPSNIIGSLDSNDFTTTSFEAIPRDGKIEITLEYTDSINERRTTNEIVTFEEDYFTGRKSQEKSYSSLGILFIIVVAIFGYFYYRSHKKKKKKKKLFD